MRLRRNFFQLTLSVNDVEKKSYDKNQLIKFIFLVLEPPALPAFTHGGQDLKNPSLSLLPKFVSLCLSCLMRLY